MATRITTLIALIVLSTTLAPIAEARNWKTLVMPGEVIAGHAKIEDDCGRCHQAFENQAQEGLCLVCHEEVGHDQESAEGFHGRLEAAQVTPCRTCHSDHRGRDEDVVGLDEETFDHRHTDFQLYGAHLGAACSDCHAAEEKYRQAPGDCAQCHGAQDVHQERLGTDCGQCHREKTWADSEFDHSRTRFPLKDGHVDVDCGLCHPGERYEKTPTDCRSCHDLDDRHQGRFEGDCSTCHTVQSWKNSEFDHGKETKFALRGKHIDTNCDGCHGEPAKSAKLEQTCVSCHRVDDEHRGTYGEDCQRCHTESGWKRTRFDHKKEGKWELWGSHADLDCGDCHRGELASEKLESSCINCHRGDDVHRNQQGEKCGSCHEERAWTKNIHFDHGVSQFPLLGLHGLATCEDCHDALTFKDAPQDCIACHERQDVHDRRLGDQCKSCHTPNDWRVWRFDHNIQTSFPLHGAHDGLDCRGCHRQPIKNKISLLKSCESCHAMEDAHRGAFGSRCEQCHTADSWAETTLRQWQ